MKTSRSWPREVYFRGTSDFDPGPATFNLTGAGPFDGVVTKVDPSGNFAWAFQVGGSGDDEIGFGTVDSLGNVYATGKIDATADFDPGPGVFNITSAGGRDAFVAKFVTQFPADRSFTLGFNSLPSAQGWTYSANGPQESAVFSVDGTKLTQNTMGTGVTYASYLKLDAIDPSRPFTIRTRARVIQSEVTASGGPATALIVYAHTGTEFFGFGLNTTTIHAPYGSSTFHSIDATQLHDYRIEAVPGQSVSIFVDDVLLIRGQPPRTQDINQLGLGNASSFENGLAEITSYSFTQGGPPPDPTVAVHVEDGRGGSDTQSFVIDVLGNRPPEIVSEPMTTAFVGQTYTYDVDAVDPDNDPLTYSLTEAPTGMSIEPDTGVISWTASRSPSSSCFPFRLGSTGQDQGLAVATDAAGNLYVAGGFSGTVDFDLGPDTYGLSSLGGVDVFVAKYDAGGRLLWARQVGTGGGDIAQDLTVDSFGNVYATGHFTGTADFDPGPGTHTLSVAGGQDVFVWKLDGGGELLWAHRVGGPGPDSTYGGVELDAAGNVYLAGFFTGTDDFDPGPETHLLSSSGGTDAFVWKLDSAGNFVWATKAGGSSDDQANGLALDQVGNVYTTGSFNHNSNETVDFDPGPDVFNLSGPYQSFVWKQDSAGQLVWARQAGADGTEAGISVAVDSLGNVYTTGQFTGTEDFDPGPGVFNLTSAGARDGYLWKLDSTGGFAWARRFGGSGDGGDGFGNLVIDSTDNVYANLSFEGTANFGPGASAFSVASRGQVDIVLAKLDGAGEVLWYRHLGGTGWDIIPHAPLNEPFAVGAICGT